MKRKVWTNKKVSKLEYFGTYVRTASDQRYFKLTPIGSSGKTHEFDSHEAAKAMGWAVKK